ncbi:DUF3352 domain-containing protein [Prochlorococcus sp. MIT 1307]|uniref:DUF3352 domain-containing protein n=1 Tax=Prochlorococcus sp. MIT 1307 TaxID=3096219 RepID=UPI002A74B5A7|nr:DUF3352 domain-containing protein [Prochlorococcus sp. MIT 1307]
MKVRPFLLSLTTALVFLQFIVFVPERVLALSGTNPTENNQLELPKTAKFLPQNSSVSLHWTIKEEKLPQYLQSTEPLEKKISEAQKISRELIENLFALAGLNFYSDLSEWIGPEISFAFFEANEDHQDFDWVMAISSRNVSESKNFLQSFWQKQRLDGIDLNLSEYRGVTLISGNQTSTVNSYQPVSTALVSDNLIVIASKKSRLEDSLSISQLPGLNQLGNQTLKQSINHLNNGLGILTISPKSLYSLFSLPLKISERDDFNGFVASFQANESYIDINGFLEFKNPIKKQTPQNNENISTHKIAGTSEEVVAFFNSPLDLLSKSSNDPLSQLIGPILVAKLQSLEGVTAKAIITFNEGPLIWLKEAKGWVIGTKKGSPPISLIDKLLTKENYKRSELLINNKIFQVWSKLVTEHVQDGDKLKTKIGAILLQDSDINWWGENLFALQQKEQTESRLKQEESGEFHPEGMNMSAMQISLNAIQAQEQLNQWYPWQLLKVIGSASITPNIQGMEISINTDSERNPNSINLNTKLDIS